MSNTILVINAGSSSVKFQMFGAEQDLKLLAKGEVSGLGNKPVFEAHEQDADKGVPDNLPAKSTSENALDTILKWIETHQSGWTIVAVGHRIVHGGTIFTGPVLLDETVMTKLNELSPLAPYHQPHNLAAVDIISRLKPNIKQIACFDTSFHAHHDPLFSAFALPQNLRSNGVRRYGFHGLSYEWIAYTLKQQAPDFSHGRIVVAHLGGGASLCALRDGVSIDTTMGMTALDGLPMGTRCGALDPGALIYMLRDLKTPIEEMEKTLYSDSGLKGLSGISGDVRDLLESDNPQARFALDYFALKVAQYALAMAVSMGGIDGFVFTGGIGENAADTRSAVLKHLSFLPPFETKVIPANEERMIAMHVMELI